MSLSLLILKGLMCYFNNYTKIPMLILNKIILFYNYIIMYNVFIYNFSLTYKISINTLIKKYFIRNKKIYNINNNKKKFHYLIRK